MDSLLGRAKRLALCRDPFPHIVVKDPIDPGLCERMLAEYPPWELIARGHDPGSNMRFSCCTVEALCLPFISELWRNFVHVHTSGSFLQEVLALFGDEIAGRYPGLLADGRPPASWRSGVRRVHDFAEADVLLDAQICVNTPVRGSGSSVRGPHVDQPDKLFVGLFYLRAPDDRSAGGDLQLYRFKGKPGGFRMLEVDDSQVEVARTVPYENNVLVLFLNSERAVHGVTVREPTGTPRWLFNVVGEVARPLFDLGRYQAVVHPHEQEERHEQA